MIASILQNKRNYEIICGKQTHTLKSYKMAHDAINIFYPDAVFCNEVKPGCYKFYSYNEHSFIYIKWDAEGDI